MTVFSYIVELMCDEVNNKRKSERVVNHATQEVAKSDYGRSVLFVLFSMDRKIKNVYFSGIISTSILSVFV